LEEIEDKYIIKIDYDPAKDDLAGSLLALSKIVEGHAQTNAILAKAFDQQVESTILMEDIQHSSIKLFIKNVLKNTDQEEIKDKGFTAFMRQALVDGRETLLDYIDDHEKIGKIEDLREVKGKLKQVAEDAGSQNTTAIQGLSERSVAEAIGGLSPPDKGLNSSQKITVIAHGKEHEVNRNFRYKSTDVEEILMASEETWRNQEKLIRIKQLAYEGESRWSIQDTDGHNYKAKILDTEWLEKFQNGQLSQEEFPFPKTVLKVRGDIQIQKDNQGFETDRHFFIYDVINVIAPNASNQYLLGYQGD